MSGHPTSAPDPLAGLSQTFDHVAAAAVAQMTSCLSPATLLQSAADWVMHLAIAPGKQVELAAKGWRKMGRLADYVASAAGGETRPAIEPLPQDHRFDAPEWKKQPFDLIQQAFLLSQQWWHAATTGVGGVSRHHETVVEFTARQILDTLAPSNFITTNPALQKRIVESGGRCLVDGARHWLEDMQLLVRGEPEAGSEAFPVGEKVAVTPGKIVFRNALMELIQYSPTTEAVRPEPVLIVPAWIMKYYILDLSPENSLVRWLVGQGFTVFMISWHNPGAQDRDRDLEDYRLMGPMAALDAVCAITGAQKVHAAGYCLGGTLLSITAAAMARDDDHRVASLSLFAAQTDFTEPGELGLFIDEAQLNLLDAAMWSRGYLDSSQMGGAFQMLRSNDLFWSRLLTTYLMGERQEMNDLMAWNADGTRMPYAMHSQYLRKLFLDNDLACGRYRIGERTITLSALKTPMFVVGTERDHVAPWHSVYKIHMLSGAEIRFVLASGGHNAGIVSEPGHPHRRYRMLTRRAGDAARDPEDWQAQAEPHDGSWWLAWGEWLAERSSEPAPPPAMGTPLAGAPGSYVLER